MIPKQISKYISKYGYKDWEIFPNLNKKFKIIVVIPAISESENITTLLSSLEKNDSIQLENTLFLFVINNLSSSSNEIKNDNASTIKFLNSYILETNNINIAYVDASTSGNEMPEKDGGVGVARKIGMDLALGYFDYSVNNALVALDSDCTVSENYLSVINEKFVDKKINAGYVNFSHSFTNDDEVNSAIICYEIFLRYYVLGLQFANSPYGFHTIGSTMICTPEYYAKIGGMNKRKAAEDFYFMEKLSKITSIYKIDGATVYPSPRGSWRVPFGTGQRVNRFVSKTHNEYELYSPKSFLLLKKWIKFFHNSKVLTSNEYLDFAKSISPVLFNFLTETKFEDNWDKILNSTKSEIQINKQKVFWFDGFKTLKLIHYLRDNLYPNQPMFSTLNEMFSIMEIEHQLTKELPHIPDINDQIPYLNKLRVIA